MNAADRWAADLAAWAIPDEILAQAPESPWIHPVEMFTVDGDVPDTVSHQRARAALPENGSVLDVGSGGGRAAIALIPPAAHLVGVDEQPRMLERFASAAQDRGVTHEEHLGSWPAIAAQVPAADVVVCHHVAYNVSALVPFVSELSAHARRRVVLELPVRHPLSRLAPYWKAFWGLDRPTGPRAEDCRDVVAESGADAQLEIWDDVAWSARTNLSQEQLARHTRIRLCLPESREPEVLAMMLAQPEPGPRRTATIWWDV